MKEDIRTSFKTARSEWNEKQGETYYSWIVTAARREACSDVSLVTMLRSMRVHHLIGFLVLDDQYTQFYLYKRTATAG
jgi:hypothetical protein